jgi:hypothetical protein
MRGAASMHIFSGVCFIKDRDRLSLSGPQGLKPPSVVGVGGTAEEAAENGH